MKHFFISLMGLLVYSISLYCSEINKIENFEKVKDGVLLKTTLGVMKLRVVNEKVVQVIASPQNVIKNTPNLSEAENLPVYTSFKVSDDSNDVILETNQVTARVSKNSPRIRFFNHLGKLILAESENGRLIKGNFQPLDSAYTVQQTFDSPDDEAIYGLGQYQYDMMNWKNSHMRMQQQNTAIAMPVIVSNKGYGIFWNNYSLTEYNPELKDILLTGLDNNNLQAAFKAEETGEYTFVMRKDEWSPVEMTLNDSVIYSHHAGVSYPTRVCKVRLEAGKTCEIKVKNLDKPINPTISSKYLRPLGGKENETGLKGEYFDNINFSGSPTFVRVDSIIDFDWGNGSPKEGFKVDEFSVRWSGKLIGSEDLKNASIDMTTDDGVRMFIDGKKVFENWRERSPETDSYTFDLEKGKVYDIVIEYYENSGGASARLSWNAQKSAGSVQFLDKVKLYTRIPSMGKSTSFKSEIGDAINYYFFYGPKPDSIIAGVRYVTGKAPLYPKWAFGLFMSQYGWDTQDKIKEIIDGYRSRSIPVDAIVQDMNYWPVEPKKNLWGSHIFDSDRYPDPIAMVDDLHKKNAHIIISVWPRINKGTDVYDTMNSKNYLLAVQDTHKNTREGIVIKDESPNAAYDAFNPEARKMYWKFMNERLFAKGFDGWWMDASEPEWGYDFSKAYTAMGPGKRYLNAYPLMAKKGVYEGQLNTLSSKRPYILTRSSFVGQQRYATTTWSGDIGPTWENYRKSIPAGLNYCLTGMPYWTLDIGGFVPDKFADSPGYPELLVRWFQYGTFLPIQRIHGCRKTPFWNYDKNTEALLTNYTNLRYRLMPFIYSMGAMVTFNDFTIYRALVMDFSNDANVYNIPDQFMFGKEMMVCPVTKPGALSRSVYLPKTDGKWTDFWTGKQYEAGTTIKANAPLDIVPIFVKAGSILPMGPFMQYASEKNAGPIELRVYTGADGKFVLYEDEGDNFNYQKGKYSTITFFWNEKSKVLTIAGRNGEFSGMLYNRKFNIVFVSVQNGLGINPEMKPNKVVEYDGTMVEIQNGTKN
jgi:alpha-D-xyloside xylohydrolase